MKRTIDDFVVDWASGYILVERKTPPKHAYLFQVSPDRARIASLYSTSPDPLAHGDAIEDAKRFERNAGKAAEEFLRQGLPGSRI